MLLTLIRAKVYGTLRIYKDFGTLPSILKSHFDPKLLIIAEQFQFYKRLKRLESSKRDYTDVANFLNEALQDRFVCEVRGEHVHNKLLAEADLTVTRALKIVHDM